MIIGAGQSLNSSSNLFQKAVLEMRYLNKYFKGKDETILGLAGVGDLYVSAAGGRNSKMGSQLGKGVTFKTAKKRFMPKETVEGEELAREITPFILKKINKKKIPLMINLLKTIKENKKLKIKAQNRPSISPSLFSLIESAAGTLGSPGIVMIVPQTTTINSAPDDSLTSLIGNE